MPFSHLRAHTVVSAVPAAEFTHHVPDQAEPSSRLTCALVENWRKKKGTEIMPYVLRK